MAGNDFQERLSGKLHDWLDAETNSKLTGELKSLLTSPKHPQKQINYLALTGPKRSLQALPHSFNPLV